MYQICHLEVDPKLGGGVASYSVNESNRESLFRVAAEADAPVRADECETVRFIIRRVLSSFPTGVRKNTESSNLRRCCAEADDEGGSPEVDLKMFIDAQIRTDMQYFYA